MRIVVVGPGAIGILYAARLACSGDDAMLLDHTPSRAQALSASGLHLASASGAPLVCRPTVLTAPPPGSEPAAAVLLCVKAYDTLAAVRHAVPFIGPDTLLVSLQNGIGHDAIMAAACPGIPLACATTNTGATLLEPGHVRQVGPAAISMAACSEAATSGCERLRLALERAGFAVDICADAEALVWTKAVVNAGINPVTALFAIQNGDVLERSDARGLMESAVREGEAAARAAGIRLLVDDAVTEAERVCRATSQNHSSMLQDVRYGRRTEIDAINGVIVARGEALGLDMAVNRKLLAQVKSMSPAAGSVDDN